MSSHDDHENQRFSAGAGPYGESFRIGETIFVVAPPAAPPRPRNGVHTAPLASLTIPCPSALEGEQDEPDRDLPDAAEVLPWDAEGHSDGGDERREVSAATGSELASRTSLPARTSGRRLIAMPAKAVQSGLAAGGSRPMWSPRQPERPAWPYRFLPAVIVLLLVATIVLVVLATLQTRRDLQAVRTTLQEQQKASSDLVIGEVRREIRGLPLPDPKLAQEQAEANARAIRELNQTIAARMRNADRQASDLTDVIRQELAQQQKQFAEQLSASAKGAAAAAAAAEEDDKNEPVLEELRELKEALATLRAQPAAHVTPPLPEAASAPQANASPLAEPPAEPPAVPAAELAPRGRSEATATLAQAAKSIEAAPAARPAAIYLIDATGELRNLIPDAIAEVRRLIQHQDEPEDPYVLMLYSERLVRVAHFTQPRDQAGGDASSAVEDFGRSDLVTAIKIAIQSRPRTLHLLSDTLGGGVHVANSLEELNRQGVRIDVTQFHSRKGQDAMKRIAREHNGFYTFIPAAR